MRRQPRQRHDIDPILDTELAVLSDTLQGDYKIFFELLLRTGVRTSEALALGARDLWVQDATGTVGIEIGRLKRRRQVRDRLEIAVPANQTLWDNLSRLGRKHRSKLFPFSRIAAWKALDRYCRSAGIRHLSPHQFRHTFGRLFASQTHYDQAGRPLSALDHKILLANVLGHSDVDNVDVYFQPHPGEITSIVGQVGSSFETWR